MGIAFVFSMYRGRERAEVNVFIFAKFKFLSLYDHRSG